MGSDVSRTEIHTSESLGTEPTAVLVVMPTKELKICDYVGTGKFSVKRIQSTIRTSRSEIYKLINYVQNQEQFCALYILLIDVCPTLHTLHKYWYR